MYHIYVLCIMCVHTHVNVILVLSVIMQQEKDVTKARKEAGIEMVKDALELGSGNEDEGKW